MKKMVFKYVMLFLISLTILGGASLLVYPAIQQIAGLAVAQSSVRWNNVKDGAAGDNLTTGVLASALYLYDGTNFDRVRGDTNGNLSVIGTETPTDTLTNPTDALHTNSLLSLFNGTTWDRVRAAQTTSVNTVMDIGVLPSAIYGYDNSGSSINTYRAVQILSSGLRTITNTTGLFTNITTNTDTLIDSGASGVIILHKVIVGQGGTGSTVVMYKESDESAPCGGTVIGTLDTTSPMVFVLDFVITEDICLTTAGTGAADIIVATVKDVD